MQDYLKIKVSIADRVYPLTIKREEEEMIRLAAKKIDGILKRYEQDYAVRDKQDLLAMACLQLASRLEKAQDENLVDGRGVDDKLQHIQQILHKALQP